MPRRVLLRFLRDKRRTLVWWVLGLGALLTIQLAMYPSMSGSSYQDIWDQMPKAMKAMFGIDESMSLTSPAGYFKAEALSLMLPMVIAIFAIGLGGGSVAGEEERGTLDLLLAHPVRRRRVVLETAAAGFLLVTALSLAALGVTLLAGPLFRLHIDVGRLLAAFAAVLSLALLFGAVGLAAGCLRGTRGVAFAAATVVALVAYFLDSLSRVTDVLRPFRPYTPFRWALGDDPLRTGFHPFMLVTLAAAALCVWFAVAAFERRDVA